MNGTKKRVLLAFSGGNDSCHAAQKLRREGYSVEALILDMNGDKAFVSHARRKALESDIPCTVLDVREDFSKRIVEYFESEYLRGRTPAPCTLCNYHIKWRYLYDCAHARGFDHIATGHYFTVGRKDGLLHPAAPADRTKDQSYYLWMLPQEILRMALTPMGDVIKTEMMRSKDSRAQRESMGVCFLRGMKYREMLKARHAAHPSCNPGSVKDSEGNTIGRHDGIAFYTAGQRKGLDLPEGMRVVGLERATNSVIAAPGRDLYYVRLVLEQGLLPDHYIGIGDTLRVKIRGIGRNPEGYCKVNRNGPDLHVQLSSPAWAPAPGQPAVFYDGDMVVGGGFIEAFHHK